MGQFQVNVATSILRKTHRASAVLIMVQGAGHTFIGGPMFFDALTQPAIWFVGAGLAMIFLGLLNLTPTIGVPRWFRLGIIVANAMFLILMFALLRTSQSWQVVAAVVIAFGCFLGSLRALGKERAYQAAA